MISGHFARPPAGRLRPRSLAALRISSQHDAYFARHDAFSPRRRRFAAASGSLISRPFHDAGRVLRQDYYVRLLLYGIAFHYFAFSFRAFRRRRRFAGRAALCRRRHRQMKARASFSPLTAFSASPQEAFLRGFISLQEAPMPIVEVSDIRARRRAGHA